MAGRPTGDCRAMPAFRRNSIGRDRKICKSVEILWPAPHRFDDKGGETIGYKDRVVFPLRIVPRKSGSARRTPPLALLRRVPGYLHSRQWRTHGANRPCRSRSGRIDRSFRGESTAKVDAESPFRVTTARLTVPKGNRACCRRAPPLADRRRTRHRELDLDIFVEGCRLRLFPSAALGRTKADGWLPPCADDPSTLRKADSSSSQWCPRYSRLNRM